MTKSMHPIVTSFRPATGMRCDSRLLSSFVTGALTATTVTVFLLRVVPGTYVVLPCDPTITARPVLLDEYLDRLDKHQEVFPDESLIDTRPLHIPFFDGQQQRVNGQQEPNLSSRQKAEEKEIKLIGKGWGQESGRAKKEDKGEDKKTKMKENEINMGPKVIANEVERNLLLEETQKTGHVDLRQKQERLQKDLEDKQQIEHHQREIQLYLQQEERERQRRQMKEVEDMMKRERAKLQKQMKKRDRRDVEKEKEINVSKRDGHVAEAKENKSHLGTDKQEAKERTLKLEETKNLRPPSDSIILRSLLSLGSVRERQRQNKEGKLEARRRQKTRIDKQKVRRRKPEVKNLSKKFQNRELLSFVLAQDLKSGRS